MHLRFGILVSAALLVTSTACSSGNASSNGAAVFSTNCSTCHSSDGRGGIAPALAANALVTGDPAKVIHIVKDGLTGAVQVNGKSYNGTMPAWKGILSNADLAGVITYIRSSWGNKASAVTTAQVSSTP